MAVHPPSGGDSWREYQNLVLAELRRLDQDIRKIEEELRRVEHTLIELKIRAGIWGMIGAAIPVIAWGLMQKFVK